jgi:hypothetical protein
MDRAVFRNTGVPFKCTKSLTKFILGHSTKLFYYGIHYSTHFIKHREAKTAQHASKGLRQLKRVPSPGIKIVGKKK